MRNVNNNVKMIGNFKNGGKERINKEWDKIKIFKKQDTLTKKLINEI